MAKYDGSGFEGTVWSTKEISDFCAAVAKRDKSVTWVDLVRDGKIISINTATMELMEFPVKAVVEPAPQIPAPTAKAPEAVPEAPPAHSEPEPPKAAAPTPPTP